MQDLPREISDEIIISAGESPGMQIVLCMVCKHTYMQVYHYELNRKSIIDLAIMYDNTALLEWFGHTTVDTTNMCIADLIAKHNAINILRWTDPQKSCKFKPMAEYAAFYGRLEMIEYLGIYIPSVFEYAAKGGQIAILQWAHTRGYLCGSDRLMHNAAKSGNLELLKWLESYHPVDVDSLLTAIKHGRVHIAEYIRGHSSRMITHILDEIYQRLVRRGDVRMLEWVHNNLSIRLSSYKNGMQIASRYDLVDVLKIVTVEPYDRAAIVSNAVNHSSVNVLRYLHAESDIVPYLLQHEWSPVPTITLELLEFLWELGIPIPANICPGNASLSLIKWLTARGFHIGYDVYENAARTGNIPVLEYLRDTGGELRDTLILGAAGWGRFNIIKWLHDNGCPWHHKTCKLIIYFSIKGVRLVREWGCPWGPSLINSLIRRGRLDMIKKVRQMGCPWGNAGNCSPTYTPTPELTEWLHANGFPCKHQMISPVDR